MKGQTWNESETYKDAWTLRPCRRITTRGEVNQGGNYQINTAFTSDGEFLVFWTKRQGRGALCKAHVPTGDITQLTDFVTDFDFFPELQGGPYPRFCVAPRNRWVVYTHQRAIKAVHMDTLEEKTLIEDIGEGRHLAYPSIDANEEFVVVPTAPMHPQSLKGEMVTKSYWECFPDGDEIDMRLLQVPLSGGEITTVYHEVGSRTGNSTHSPVDPDLIMIDRDRPPRYWGSPEVAPGHTRCWILQASTQELTPIFPQEEQGFQVHCCWTFDGENILYHGKLRAGGKFIGASKKTGKNIVEYHFKDIANYGHVSAMAGRPAVILDGDMSSNLLIWLYYDDIRPRVEVIAEHNTQWGSILGQTPHPHPLSDPTGHWISFTTARNGRCDVVVVDVS